LTSLAAPAEALSSGAFDPPLSLRPPTGPHPAPKIPPPGFVVRLVPASVCRLRSGLRPSATGLPASDVLSRFRPFPRYRPTGVNPRCATEIRLACLQPQVIRSLETATLRPWVAGTFGGSHHLLLSLTLASLGPRLAPQHFYWRGRRRLQSPRLGSSGQAILDGRFFWKLPPFSPAGQGRMLRFPH